MALHAPNASGRARRRSGLPAPPARAYAARIVRAGATAMQATAAIHRATPADLDALLALEEASFDVDRISRRQWRRHIDSSSASVLVHGARGAIDAAAVVFHPRHARIARLYSLAVAAHARGQRLGGALLAAAEAVAVARGCTTLRLEVRFDNPAAIALYERRGYIRTARLAGFYEDGADAFRYARALTAVTR